MMRLRRQPLQLHDVYPTSGLATLAQLVVASRLTSEQRERGLGFS
jgi:hypothetical protein